MIRQQAFKKLIYYCLTLIIIFCFTPIFSDAQTSSFQGQLDVGMALNILLTDGDDQNANNIIYRFISQRLDKCIKTAFNDKPFNLKYNELLETEDSKYSFDCPEAYAKIFVFVKSAPQVGVQFTIAVTYLDEDIDEKDLDSFEFIYYP